MFALAAPLAASYMMLSMVRLPRPAAAVHARVIQTSQRVQSVPLASNATQAARSMLFLSLHYPLALTLAPPRRVERAPRGVRVRAPVRAPRFVI